jgi:hypothetical protein
MTEPILAEWTDEGTFKPLGRHAKACDARFTIGERYFIDPEAPRNMATHRAYFAQIKDGWLNLPEAIAADHPSPEHLRKFALVQCGYADEKTILCRTNKDAVMAAAFIGAMDGFAIVDVRGNVLKAWKPRSQSVKAMGADEFKRSKSAVLDFISGMIGVSPASLEHAGEAA